MSHRSWKRLQKQSLILGADGEESQLIFISSDPRRPEKDYYLALECGRELETRGWVVGITTLKQQPRDLVWDRRWWLTLPLLHQTRK